MKHFLWVVAFGSLLPACGADDPAAPELALVRPPVEAVTPAGFLAGSKPTAHLLDPEDFHTRFFTEGPTAVLAILDTIDGRIAGYNERPAPCLTQDPVAYTITAFGQTIPMFAQCYEDELDGAGAVVGFRQFGVADGATYIFIKGVAARAAAIVTDDGADIYLTVGEDAHFADQSYGVIQLHADDATGGFEMAVAGMGFGYCGAQLHADGLSVYGTGSADMGATCGAIDTLCSDAVDLTAAGACDAIDTFALPALGRTAAGAFGASQYPTTPNVTLDGTATDALHFGPSEPTAGVAEL